MSAYQPLEIIDLVVHPSVHFEGNLFKAGSGDVDELRTYMVEPWRSRPFPGPHRHLYPVPTGIAPYGEYTEAARLGDGLASCQPVELRRQLDELGIGRAVLTPLTRGLMPDIDLGNAICAATNDWLAAKWLGDANQSARFLGSIRINPIDSHAAVREIERWADHPAMVQVAVPLEAHRPYGQRNYAPIWETAARNSLPIAVHSDGGAGVDFFVTANGYPRHHIEYSTLMPINFIYHLTSLIAEGTFERIPGLKFVFADGGHDVLAPLMWRMDMDWPISGMQTPWVSRRPSEYLRTNVRFITNLLEGPHGRVPDEEWLNVSDAEALLLYGSNYPQWSYISPEFARSQMPAKVWTRVARDNALSFYGPRLS